MDNIDFVKLIGQGGIAVAALAVLAKMVYKIGERMIAAIDRVGSKIEEHTKADLLAHADVGNQVGDLRQDVAVLSERVDTVLALDRSGRHVSPHEERAAFGSSPPPGPLQPLRQGHISERRALHVDDDEDTPTRVRRRRDGDQ